MRVAVTGATGFLGRYIVARLVADGHRCVCWHRPTSDLSGIPTRGGAVTWLEGGLEDDASARELVRGCDAVVHAALDRPDGRGFRGDEGDLIPFVEKNLVGSLRLMEESRDAGVGRFLFISTCAVHERILPDRPLDETHPLWPGSHYGAYKAAVEAFVHSFAQAEGFPACALRPTGIYGLAHPPHKSKWFDLVRKVARGEDVECHKGGKEVHAADVARATALLLAADPSIVTGEAFSCYDMYISDYEVANVAKDLTNSSSTVAGETPKAKNQIETGKLRSLGMTFGGKPLLETTVNEMLKSVSSQHVTF